MVVRRRRFGKDAKAELPIEVCMQVTYPRILNNKILASSDDDDDVDFRISRVRAKATYKSNPNHPIIL